MGVEQTMYRQGLIANETFHYLKRDFKKYAKGAVGMWVVFGTNFETGDAFRSAYYFIRHLDDILDNDRSIRKDPFKYAYELRTCIQQRDFDFKKFPILHLAKNTIDYLDKVKRHEDDPQKEMLQLIDSMIFDRYRMQNRVILPNKELLEVYRRQFNPIMNLQLTLLNSKMRVNDISNFPILQGRIYSLIDMKDDWKKGIINMPSEVLAEAGLSANSDFEMVKISPIIQKWIENERIECGKLLNVENEKIAGNFSKEPVTKTILKNLSEKMMKYVEN